MTLTYSKAVHAVTGEEIAVEEGVGQIRLPGWGEGQWLDWDVGPHGDQFEEVGARFRSLTRPCSWALIFLGDHVIATNGDIGLVENIQDDGQEGVEIYINWDWDPSADICDTFSGWYDPADLTLVIDPDNPPEHRKGNPAWMPSGRPSDSHSGRNREGFAQDEKEAGDGG